MRANRKIILIISLLIAEDLAPQALALPADIFGGTDGSTQTIVHCGLLPTSGYRYTTSPITTRLIQQKLDTLGYYHAYPTGFYDRTSQRAVKSFQREYGLTPDGIVGPATAQRLAFEAHPHANVRRCFRTANARF